MKKLLALFLIFPIFIYADKSFTTSEIAEAHSNPVFTKEITAIQEIGNTLITLIQYQNSLQTDITNLVNTYLESEMTNEELSEGLNKIEAKLETFSEDMDLMVSDIPINTSIQDPVSISLYKDAVENIYNMNTYQVENNKTTRDLLKFLKAGDLDKYEYLNARSFVRSADFLELIAKNNKASVQKIPDNNINKHALLVDSDVINFIAKAQRLNAFFLMGELDKSKLNEHKDILETAYKPIQKRSSYKKFKNRLDNYKKGINELVSVEGVEMSHIQIMNDVATYSELVTDMNIKNAEAWKEITDFYYKNSDNPASILESDLLVAQYNEIVEKQSFIQDKLSEYSLLYEEAKINFVKISPELMSLK